MLCKRCMVVMKAGTRYERRKGEDRLLERRFQKCNDRIYTKELNFQEYLSRALEKKV